MSFLPFYSNDQLEWSKLIEWSKLMLAFINKNPILKLTLSQMISL